jgi:hypothetical protein
MTTRIRPSRPTLLRAAALGLGLALLADAGAHADTKRWFIGSDKVFIRQHETFVRVQEPDVHMSRARRGFVKDRRSYAADELEKAAVGFAYFAQRTAGEDRRRLETAEKALSQLADQIRRGDVDEVTTLDRALEDASRALAGQPEKAAAAPAAPSQ